MKLLLPGVVVLLGFGSAFAEPAGPDRYGDPLPSGAVARLGSLRLFCADDVANVVFTPDGRTVAAVLENGGSQFWEVATGRAALAPADTNFVKEDADRRRNQWQETCGRLHDANPTLTGDDLKLAVVSPDGALIAISSGRQPIRIWDGRTLKELPSWPGQKTERIDSLAFSPDGKALAATSPQFTEIWETGSGKLRHTLPGLGWQSFASTFSPDGKTLGVADGQVVTLWNASNRALLSMNLDILIRSEPWYSRRTDSRSSAGLPTPTGSSIGGTRTLANGWRPGAGTPPRGICGWP